MFEAFRVRVVRDRIRGRVLDVGAWQNRWVEQVDGISVNYITEAPDGEAFDTVTMLALLNYVSNEERTPLLQGCHSRLRRYGRLLVTCITPLGSLFLPTQPRGLHRHQVLKIIQPEGFKLIYDKPFMLGLNRLYVFSKEIKKETLAVKDYRKEVDEVKKII